MGSISQLPANCCCQLLLAQLAIQLVAQTKSLERHVSVGVYNSSWLAAQLSELTVAKVLEALALF